MNFDSIQTFLPLILDLKDNMNKITHYSCDRSSHIFSWSSFGFGTCRALSFEELLCRLICSISHFSGICFVLFIAHHLNFLFCPARLSVGVPSVTPPGGQTTTTRACITLTALACPIGARMHAPITSQTQTHPSLRMKCLLWPQIAPLPRWVNMYWKKREDYQRRLLTNLNNNEQGSNGKFTASFYVFMHPF